MADISLGKANVYYEIGVRHAAQRYGCVLTSAEWARVLFDIAQMPRVVYHTFRDSGRSPRIPGVPGHEAARGPTRPAPAA